MFLNQNSTVSLELVYQSSLSLVNFSKHKSNLMDELFLFLSVGYRKYASQFSHSLELNCPSPFHHLAHKKTPYPFLNYYCTCLLHLTQFFPLYRLLLQFHQLLSFSFLVGQKLSRLTWCICLTFLVVLDLWLVH